MVKRIMMTLVLSGLLNVCGSFAMESPNPQTVDKIVRIIKENHFQKDSKDDWDRLQSFLEQQGIKANGSDMMEAWGQVGMSTEKENAKEPKKKKGFFGKVKESVGFGKKEKKENVGMEEKEKLEKEPAFRISLKDIAFTCPTTIELGEGLLNVKVIEGGGMTFTNSEGLIFKGTLAPGSKNIGPYFHYDRSIGYDNKPSGYGVPVTKLMGVWSDKTNGKIQCAYSVFFKDRDKLLGGHPNDVLLLDLDFEKMNIKATDIVFPDGGGDMKLDEVESYLENQNMQFNAAFRYLERWFDSSSKSEVFHKSDDNHENTNNVKFIIPKTETVKIDHSTPGILVFAHTANNEEEYIQYGKNPLSCDLFFTETEKETFVVGQNDNIVDKNGKPAICTIELINAEDPSKRYSIPMPNSVKSNTVEKGESIKNTINEKNEKPEPGNYVAVVKCTNAKTNWGTGSFQAICSQPK